MIIIVFPFIWAIVRRLVPFVLFAFILQCIELMALAHSWRGTGEAATVAAALVLMLVLWLRHPLWRVVRWARGRG